MSYITNGLIQASDYNTFATQLNTLWATGSGPQGLGQTAIPLVTKGNEVTASQWDSILSVISALAAQQSPSSQYVTQPDYVPSNSGSDAQALIRYISSISTNISTLSSNYLNAASQVSTTPAIITSTQRWSNQAVYTFTVQFSSGDAARYFFNAGGQLKLSMSHPTGTPLDSMFRLLCQQIGTLVISAPGLSPSTTHIAGVDYQGLTQVITQQGAVPDSFLAQAGYYGLTAASTEIFKQRMDTGFYSNYLGSSITVRANTNGTQGGNNDNGSSVTIEVIWSEIPPTLFVSVGTQIALTIVRPALSSDSGSSSPLVKAWGTYLVQASQSYI